MSATTRFTDPTLPEPPALHLALELSNRSWKLAFSTGHGQKPRFRNIAARDLDALTREIALARKRFDLPDSVPVISCFEAGRDGFWIHRFLQTQPHSSPSIRPAARSPGSSRRSAAWTTR